MKNHRCIQMNTELKGSVATYGPISAGTIYASQI
ncbi:MAG: hypothetical protein AB201_03120 [Parcubacteria bacterium C7867-006]|nr:MAG: hypothetical protein AB201_03120 [Parcubacteria bacterium C7867-006]